jgi:hypothetical protein
MQSGVTQGPGSEQITHQALWRLMLRALLGIKAAEQPRAYGRSVIFSSYRPQEGLQRLWGLLYSGSATTAAELQVGATAAQVLALMVGLGITAVPAAGVACAASCTVAGLARLLKHLLANQQQAPAAAMAALAAGASPAPCASSSGGGSGGGRAAVACTTTGFVVSCLAALVKGDQLQQLAALECVHTLPAARSMLAQLHLQGAGLQLLQALASSPCAERSPCTPAHDR